jgi:hypothetical protein
MTARIMRMGVRTTDKARGPWQDRIAVSTRKTGGRIFGPSAQRRIGVEVGCRLVPPLASPAITAARQFRQCKDGLKVPLGQIKILLKGHAR